MQTDLVILANSPGELSALVKPVVEAFNNLMPTVRKTIVLTPCQYSSGKEVEYLQSLPGIDQIVTVEQFKNWAFFNRKPTATFSPKGAVLFLGGDLLYGIIIAKKLHYPAFAYLQGHLRWIKSYQKFFVPDQITFTKLIKNKTAQAKTIVCGDLMVDSMQNLPDWQPGENVITLLPGSRRWQIEYMLPFYSRLMQAIHQQMPEVIFQSTSSPFEKSPTLANVKKIDFKDVHQCTLAITIPGTSTAHLAIRGIPMLMVLPLDQPEAIPLEGIPHFISKIPFLGKQFKKLLAAIFRRKMGLLALPNIKAGKEIVPEIKGKIDLPQLAAQIIALLKDTKRRENMSQDLKKAFGQPGAAKKIVEELYATLSTIT